MNDQPTALPTVISYARGPHDAQVVALAQQLISEGVPCDVDIFDARPKGGWSRWMTEKMMGTSIVLVVCEEAYYQRYHLQEAPGVGTGATFEGGMLGRRVLDAQGSEHGVIPIAFDRQDVQWRPEFLRDETFFVLPQQYDDLYRVLTNQPAFVKPPLGHVRRMPPLNAGPNVETTVAPTPASSDRAAADQSLPLAVFYLPDANLVFARYAEFARENSSIRMNLVIEEDRDVAQFALLRHQRGEFGIAWGLNAAIARIKTYREIQHGRERVVEVDLSEVSMPSRFGGDAAVNGITPDQIALRRARRILLDERAPAAPDVGVFSSQRLNEEVLEYHVSGEAGTGTKVIGSPIPGLIAGTPDLALALEAARIVCVLFLIITHTVERVVQLNLSRVSNGVSISFEGIRARQYSNTPPTMLQVSGTCPLV
ncbi:MAG: toll/interleukin-1 receptor domain-containing protein [Frankiaceae bacterium]|nr:toll/interleukin-1 receptor domain-containing protein [Frankiaceae bacterium]